MNAFRKSRRLTLLAIVSLILAMISVASGQDRSLPTTPDSAEKIESNSSSTQDDASKKSFLEIVTQIQNNEKEINHLFTTMPIGFPKQQRLNMDKIERLRADNATLQSLMDAAALAALQTNASGDRRAARIVFNLLTDKIDVNSRDGFFDPNGALKIAEMMLKARSDSEETPGNIPKTDIAYQAFRASFAVQDFELADSMLKLIENAGISLRPVIRQQVEETREKWNRELMIRRLESSTDDLPRVKFETTAGDFVVELFETHAPQTVGNFLSLVEKHLYDDLIFFRVVPGEFAQTGCPSGDGTGDPGYLIPCECDREEIRHHFAGTLSMVNNGKDTGGSQFRILHQPSGQYDGKNTAFGRVIEGMDVVYQLRRIDKTKTDTVNNNEPVKIIKATVLRKRDHDYPFSRITKKPKQQDEIFSLPRSLEPDKSSTPGGG